MAYLIVWILLGLIAGYIGSSRGDNGCGWFVIGLILGPFGILFSFFAKGKQQQELEKAQKGKSSKIKICPKCAEPVKKLAEVCKHCGHEFDLESFW